MNNRVQRPNLRLIQGGKKDKNPWAPIVLIFILSIALLYFIVAVLK